MSTERKTWSGNAEDFDDLYGWAGKKDVMETRATEDTEYQVEIFHPSTGWVHLPAGAEVEKDEAGVKLAPAAVEESAAEEIEKPSESDGTENKNENKGVETKPAASTESTPIADAAAAAVKPAKTAAPASK